MIRVATEADVIAACNVLRRSISECCIEDHQNDEARLAPWLSNKTPENVLAWINEPSNTTLVAEVDGEIVGFAAMTDSGEISLCYILPEVRYTGVGKALLAGLESRARELGLPEARLNSTKTAHAFYLRNGFESSGPADSWHGVSCYPMTKKLSTDTNAAE